MIFAFCLPIEWRHGTQERACWSGVVETSETASFTVTARKRLARPANCGARTLENRCSLAAKRGARTLENIQLRAVSW
jgi:hypothetical protein